jgi:hypothetical protein
MRHWTIAGHEDMDEPTVSLSAARAPDMSVVLDHFGV